MYIIIIINIDTYLRYIPTDIVDMSVVVVLDPSKGL